MLIRYSSIIKGVKWIVPSSPFYPLFLGEQPQALVAKSSPVEKVRRPSSLVLSGWRGVFPSWKNPRVLWLGVEQGREELQALAAEVTAACVQHGLPKPNRPFAPHLTLGRVKTPPVVVDRALLAQGVTGAMRVDRFTFFASELRPQGPLYRELITYRLGSVSSDESP